MNLVQFDHKRDRRSLATRYAELEGEVSAKVQAAIQNERVTRDRVEMIEAYLTNWGSLTLKGRLRCLLFGK